METYCKLDSGITKSSLWSEKLHTRILFVSMLAEKDQNGMVWASRPGLARIANITLEQFDEAISVLESPDSNSRTSTDDGIRVKKVDGGWLVVNHEKYRAKNYSSNPDAVRMRTKRTKANISEHSRTMFEHSEQCSNIPEHAVYVSVSDPVSVSKEIKKQMNSVGEILNEPYERFKKDYPPNGSACSQEVANFLLKASFDAALIELILKRTKEYDSYCRIAYNGDRFNKFIARAINWLDSEQYNIDWAAKKAAEFPPEQKRLYSFPL